MRRIYLHEFNILMDRKVYLPNVSGMLRAYAETVPEISESFEFMPFVFVRERPEAIAERWEAPSVLAFSSSMWNHELNLVLAQIAREKFPDALIVFGGPHVPTDAEGFLQEHPFVDVAVLGEGETTFAEVLKVYSQCREFSSVKGIAYRTLEGGIGRTPAPTLADVNQLPSPYLAGYYDDILAKRGEMEYQVILETNRGCPFRCGFCYWGNGTTKVRMFDIERIALEIAWLRDMKIPYVFGADANFGQIGRDHEIARLFAEAKRAAGFPRTFRVCYGKNAVDRVFKTAQVLESNGLTSGVTVSFQSTDQQTLVNIGRSNIKIDVYRELLQRYRSEGIRVYTELILGLPGETYKSFARGIEEVFQAGLYDQVGIFFCQVLPNTEMDNPEYRAAHGIRTQKIELSEFHALRRNAGEVVEYEEIVVETSSMPLSEWEHAATLAWMAQTLHGLKLGFFIALYLFHQFGIKYTELFGFLLDHGAEMNYPVFAREIARYRHYLKGLLSGKPQCVFLDEFGRISWQVEEATFLHLVGDLPGFYREFEMLSARMLAEKGFDIDPTELADVFQYQLARVANLDPYKPTEYSFRYNVPEYFDRLLRDQTAELVNREQHMRVDVTNYDGDKEEYARKVIWYGRRDCRAIEPATWS